MDIRKTAWLICLNVLLFHSRVQCNLTTSQNNISNSSLENASSKSLNVTPTTPLNGTPTTSHKTAPTTSLNTTSLSSGSNHSDLWLIENYQKLIDIPTNEAKKLFYVSSPEQDSFSLHFKHATDQIYFLDYNVSQMCSKHMANISEGIKRDDLWALAFLDSNGQQPNFKSINNVKMYGSLEQCETINVLLSDDDVIAGKHITMSFLTSLENKAPLKLSISWYFCLPSSCTSDDYASIAKTFEGAFGVYDIDVYISKLKESPKDHWYWLAIVTLSTLTFICLLSTVIDCLYTYCLTKHNLNKENSHKQQEEGENIRLVTKDDAVMKEKLSKCSGNRYRPMLQAFSLRRNLNDILKTTSSKGDIGCLHGLRVLSMMWVIFGHVSNSLPDLREPRQRLGVSKNSFAILSYSAPYAVDSFFLMSGCLVSYLFIKTVNKVGQLKPMHMVMYYIHRYIRLTPLYLLTIIIYTGILPTLVTGTVARKLKEKCDTYWWRNILYISNFFTFKDMCMSWSWYLPNDMQFYIIAPIVTVPIVYGFHKIGLTTACLMLMCHIGASTLTLEVFRETQTSEKFDYVTDFYAKPWNRVGPYAIGLVLGYFLSSRQRDLKVNKLFLTVGWLTCTALCLILVINEDYSSKIDFDLQPNLGTTKRRVFEIVKSPLWVACVTWIIIASHYGYGGLLNTFLTWKAWIPVSKLTYGTYMCHKIIIIYFNLSVEYGVDFYVFYLVERFIYTTFFSYVMSLILSVLIEIPTRNLLNAFQKSSENHGLYRLVKTKGVESKVKSIQ